MSGDENFDRKHGFKEEDFLNSTASAFNPFLSQLLHTQLFLAFVEEACDVSLSPVALNCTIDLLNRCLDSPSDESFYKFLSRPSNHQLCGLGEASFSDEEDSDDEDTVSTIVRALPVNMDGLESLSKDNPPWFKHGYTSFPHLTPHFMVEPRPVPANESSLRLEYAGGKAGSPYARTNDKRVSTTTSIQIFNSTSPGLVGDLMTNLCMFILDSVTLEFIRGRAS